MNALSSNPHHCHVCHRSYKRPEHLQRHVAVHKTGRRYTCAACSGTFSRSDALRRHLKTCIEQHGSVNQRTSRRRACDRCVRLKRACDFNEPCQTCVDRNTACIFTPPSAVHSTEDQTSSSVSANFSGLPLELFDNTPWADMDPGLFELAATSWDDFLSLLPPHASQDSGEHLQQLRFLENFTKHSGLVKSFDCGTPEMRQVIFEKATHTYRRHSSVVDPKELEKDCLSDPLSSQCRTILLLLREVAVIKPRNSSVEIIWSDLTQDLCSEFFNPSNIRKCLELYWSVWHPNVNILHRPTFDENTAKPALLAAMTVIGASVSTYDRDRESARSWFNSVEEIVFIDDDFCGDNGQSFPTCSKLQAMQAAYIVCLYQNWEGTDQSKQRIRRHRFGTLVSIARDIGMDNARHLEYNDIHRFNWLSFTAREQLIRVFLWVFLLDTAFVIFNNLPPRMVITEMTMGLASCEAVFQAVTKDECHALLQQKPQATKTRLGPRIDSLYQAAKILCNADLHSDLIHQLADLGPLNLFAITSSLHSMLFHYQNNFHSQNQLDPIRNSLENWRLIWTAYSSGFASTPLHSPCGDNITAENMWKRVGFVRYASEYWLLASLVLDRICAAERDSSDQSITMQSEEHSLTEEAPVLSKYDQTSMQQVNDLITDFQRTTIS